MPKTDSRWSSRVLNAAFLVLISAPLAAFLSLDTHDEDAVSENRNLAPAPKATSIDDLSGFAQSFDGFFQDRFGFRSWLIETHTRFKILFDVSPSDKVIVGKDGWLFYTGNRVIESYRGLRPVQAHQLPRITRFLETRRAWLAAQGIEHLFMVAPDKHTIYGEHLPARITRGSTSSRLDQLKTYLAAHSSFGLIDIREEMIEAKRDARVYHKSDSHWNQHGAFLGYQALATRISSMFPDWQPTTVREFDISWETGAPGDLGRILNIDGLYDEERIIYTPSEPRCAAPSAPLLDPAEFKGPGVRVEATRCDSGSLDVVFFRDSFGGALVRFLREDFEFFEHVNRRFDQQALSERIARKKPHLVVEVYVERLAVRNPPRSELNDIEAALRGMDDSRSGRSGDE